jgi:hypothetical protein
MQAKKGPESSGPQITSIHLAAKLQKPFGVGTSAETALVTNSKTFAPLIGTNQQFQRETASLQVAFSLPKSRSEFSNQLRSLK